MGNVWHSRKWYMTGVLGASVIVGSLILCILYLFDPETCTFYPRCPFFVLTGWQCPGCGALRAVHHVLHGNFVAAFIFNPYMFLVMSLIVLMICCRRMRHSGLLAWFLVITTFIWWLLRNIIA